jgi:hypothetical protein
MFTLSQISTIPPISVSAIIVDLRNFTPHLAASPEDREGISSFCHFLTRFYGLCLESCLVAHPLSVRHQPPLYMSSTGDGLLIVFYDQLHYLRAFLAAHIMHIQLRKYCEQYNRQLGDPLIPPMSFGLGMESGTASRLRALSMNATMLPVVDTFIGHCINVAARAETITKTLYKANSIIGPRINELLCKELWNESYDEMEKQAKDRQISDPDLFAIYARMDDINRRNCITYVHHHVLKGVPHPVALFRLSDRSMHPNNSRFRTLLRKLVRDSESHLEEVMRLIATDAPAVQ